MRDNFSDPGVFIQLCDKTDVSSHRCQFLAGFVRLDKTIYYEKTYVGQRFSICFLKCLNKCEFTSRSCLDKHVNNKDFILNLKKFALMAPVTISRNFILQLKGSWYKKFNQSGPVKTSRCVYETR